MKKILLPETGGRYKANLHCHTTVSDGRMTPEEVKEYYMERGYSIVAYTDHEILVDQSHLTDENFLALNGYELAIADESDKPFKFKKTCHFCGVAIEPDNVVNVACNKGEYVERESSRAYLDKVVFDENEPDIKREYTPECISEMMKRCRDAGFFVTYNHPGWSFESYPEFMSYQGYHAIEIMNYASYVEGYPEHNETYYDDILRSGRRIFAVADDDNHAADTSCGAYVVIAADKLEYRTVTAALVRGDFYASEGPEIKALWYEDGRVHIKTSPARQIRMNLGVRGARVKTASDSLLTEVSFPLDSEAGYFRLTVQDDKGLFAYTNAYFLDELGIEKAK